MGKLQTVESYHTNDSGRTLPCTAGVRDCRYVHGNTPLEAAENWQKQMQNELIPQTISKEESKELRLKSYREMSLKHMNDSELAETIILESEALGFDTNRIAKAIALAAELHGDQNRKGNRGNVSNPPYIEHPLRNTLRLIRLGCRDEPIINGSTLHDTVEDGSEVFAKRKSSESASTKNIPLARKELTVHIEVSFGKDTAEIVLAVTNDLPPHNGGKPLSVDQKHAIYVEHLRQQILKSPGAYLVKISDFIDNATGLHHGVGTMDPVKLSNQARKYLKAIPVFEEGLRTLNLPLPTHSKDILHKCLGETKRRLSRIANGWDGNGKI